MQNFRCKVRSASSARVGSRCSGGNTTRFRSTVISGGSTSFRDVERPLEHSTFSFGCYRKKRTVVLFCESYLAEQNADPKPFRWKADPDTIIAAAARGHQTLDSIQ